MTQISPLRIDFLLLSSIFRNYTTNSNSSYFSLFSPSPNRNVIYNLSITDLAEQQKILWRASEDDYNMCIVKGKDEVMLSSCLARATWVVSVCRTSHTYEKNEQMKIMKIWLKTHTQHVELHDLNPTSNHSLLCLNMRIENHGKRWNDFQS